MSAISPASTILKLFNFIEANLFLDTSECNCVERCRKQTFHTRLQNYLDLLVHCRKLGVAVVDVPGDGNCLVWSLLSLVLQNPNLELDHKKGMKLQKSTRTQMARMWEDVAGDLRWQNIWKFLCHDKPEPPDEHSHPPDSQEIVTPKKGKASKKPAADENHRGLTDLDNKLSPIAKPNRPKRIGADGKPRAVPVALPAPKSPLKFKTPEDAAAQSLVEPPMPDVEDLFTMAMEENTKKRPQSDAEMAEDDQERLDSKKVRRSEHRRSYKTAPVTENKRREALVKSFLAKRNLTYGRYISFHRMSARVRTSAGCETGGPPDGGYVALRKALQQAQFPKRGICCTWLRENGVTVDKLADLFDGATARDSEEFSLVPTNTDTEGTHKRKRDDAEELQAIKDYIESVSEHIQLVENGTGELRYRCRLCTSKNHPQGKDNILQRRVLSSVKHFINTHLGSVRHVQRLEQMDIQADTDQSNRAGEQVPCEGYCVSNSGSSGVLHFYLEEFKLWAAHSKLDGVVSHSYWQDAGLGHWYLRHKDCSKVTMKMESDPYPCCSKCQDLGDRKKVVKVVLRFVSKFYSALLLNKRLFACPEEVSEFENVIMSSAFGRNHSQHWKNQTDTTLVEHQRMVRAAWSTVSPDNRTQAMEHFISAVVTPVLKINVSAASPHMTNLSSQFVQALAGRKLNVPWYT